LAVRGGLCKARFRNDGEPLGPFWIVTNQVAFERANCVLGAFPTASHLSETDQSFIGLDFDDSADESAPVCTIGMTKRSLKRNRNRSRANIRNFHWFISSRIALAHISGRVRTMRNNVKPDGSLGEAGGQDGMLYYIDPDGRTSIHRRNIGISNTLAWSPDRLRFYSGDTLANVIRAYDYDPQTGDMANERPFLKDFSRGLPDGSSVDSERFLWNCRFFGGCIVRVAPDGQIDAWLRCR
jgi:hypothetical protein